MLKPLNVWITTNCGKLFKRWEYQTCLPQSLYAGQEATARTWHGTTDWFKDGRGYVKAVYCHSAHLPHMQSVCVLSCFSHVWFHVTLWKVTCQAPLSKGFSRQVYWSRLPFLPPEYLADPGIEPLSPVSHALQADSLPAELLRNLFYPNR